MKKIWRDFSIKRIIFLTITLSTFIVFAGIFYKTVLKEIEAIVSFLLISTFSLGYATNILRTRLTYLTKEGVRLGNAQDDIYEKIRLPHRPIFIKWAGIKKVSIKGRQIKRPTYMDIINFLIITTKEGKRYECFIAKPIEFVKVARSLGKSHLFSKDSKFID